MSILKPIKAGAPAYAPFYAVEKYIDYVSAHGVPETVSTEVLSDLGQTVRAHLLTSLCYLNLITPEREPTSLLRRFAETDHDGRQQLYQEMIIERYAFIAKKHPGLVGLDPKLLRRKFEALGITGSTVKKCVSFFLELARQAGWQMEANTVRKIEVADTPPATEQFRGNGKAQEQTSREDWARSMLPKYDANWSAEVQAKWFDAYTKLISE